MNWAGLLSVVLGVFFFTCAARIAQKPILFRFRVVAFCISLILALPGVLYAIYYFRMLGEPIWLYRTRTVPGTEFLASLSGFAAGLVQTWIVPRLKLSPIGKRALVPIVLVFFLALPYLKPILRPLKREVMQDRWVDGVCLQSTLSTCGPASVATIVHALGANVSERQLADEALTSDRGTENWYLARALHRRGFETTFTLDGLSAQPPALLGVRLLNYARSGHFIALLGRAGDRFVIADPMEGRSTNSVTELEEKFEFTGFAMLIRKR